MITTAGPEPAEAPPRPLDYEHYLDKQVRAVAEPVLALLGLDLDQVVGDGEAAAPVLTGERVRSGRVKKDPKQAADRLISGKLRAKAGRRGRRRTRRARGRHRLRLGVSPRLGRLGQGHQGHLRLGVPHPGRTRELILDFTMKVGPEDGPPSDGRVVRALAPAIRAALEAGWDPESRGRAFRHEVAESI